MKNIFFLFLLLFTISCTSEKTSNTDLYIYLDFTEGQTYENLETDIDKYLELMQITQQHNRNYGTIRIYPLYDMASAVSTTVKLKEGKSKLEGNKYVREKEINQFKEKVLERLTNLNTSHAGKALNKSHIYQPICKGFKKLDNSNADHKIVLIYSDMLENSDLANFHSKSLDYKSMKSKFDKKYQIADLSEIELFIIYPIHKNNDQKITKALKIWKQFFAEKGMEEDQLHVDTGIDI